MSKINVIRAVTHHLNNTPVKELPHIAYFLASSIAECGDILKATPAPSAGKNDDSVLQIHKLKAKIVSLIQDRSAEGRFTAVVLVKATVEAGGREILASCEPWLRGLLAILSRPDSVSSKKLCLLTITRIFSLTQQYPTLIREITTPLLPAFVTACMNLGALNPPRSDEGATYRPTPYLETVLHCMLLLVPDHPTTFRPFASKLQLTLVKFIGGQSSSDQITLLAQTVFVALHFCAPKNTAGNEWLNACLAVTASIHTVADQIFRAVVEDRDASDNSQRQIFQHKIFEDLPHSRESDPLGLPPWEGVYRGSRVLISLLNLLKAFVCERSSQPVSLPVGLFLDMSSRLLYIRVPANGKESQASVRFNPEIGREEREELLAILPDIHQATMDLLCSLIEVGGLSMLPASQTIIDQCVWTFGPESSKRNIRFASYKLLENLVALKGASMTKDSFKPLLGVIELCCKDACQQTLESESIVQSKPESNSKSAVNGHADSFLQPSAKRTAKPQRPISALETAASKMLCEILEHVPAQAIPHSVRSQIDRTAILNDQQRLMLASVLNPAPQMTGKHVAPSIMPFLARSSHIELEVECLLRPRMPVIREAKMSPYDREDESNEGMEMECAKDSEFKDRRTETPVEDARAHNDILDRLEDSIDDRALPISKVETPQLTAAHPPWTKPLSQGNGGRMNGSPFYQGSKRSLDTVDMQQEEEPNKRLRNNEIDLKLTAPAQLENTTAVPYATESVNVDPGLAVSIELEPGETVSDKGKGRAKSISPTSGGLVGFGQQNVDNEDDESDSDIPPLYLKTSSEEEDEDDDEDML
jgi:pre-rRNA-processing protein RIX1